MHTKAIHSSASGFTGRSTEIPTVMKIDELKKSLRARGLSTSGNKLVLVKRLEGALVGEK